VLDGAEEQGTVDVGGERWTRSTTTDGETALSREDGAVTVLVTGSAPDEELRTVAESVRPYSG
jgi:anti-sigma factor RsiW